MGGGGEELIDLDEINSTDHPQPKSAIKKSKGKSGKNKAIYKQAFLMLLVDTDHPLREELYGRLKARKSGYPHIFVPVKWKRIKSEAVIRKFEGLSAGEKLAVINKSSTEDALLMLDKKGMLKLFAVKIKDTLNLKNQEIFSTAQVFSSKRKYQFVVQKIKGLHARDKSPKKWLGKHESDGGYLSLA